MTRNLLAYIWFYANIQSLDNINRDILKENAFIMPPTLKKWGTYWFRLVRVRVCVYGASRYRLETSCMDSLWKNSRGVFLVFPELSRLVKLQPFDKQGGEIL